MLIVFNKLCFTVFINNQVQCDFAYLCYCLSCKQEECVIRVVKISINVYGKFISG